MSLTVRDARVRLDGTAALDGAELTVASGELVALLGPSGSGKSTLLRAIAGLLALDAGSVWWGGEDLTSIPAHQRRFGLMFQDYALFPHLSVAGNVGYGLRMEGNEAPAIKRRVAEALSWVGLDGQGNRRIDTLSGGEQQRVALARTLVPSPRLVMLDEPLGALDRQIRGRLMSEIRQLLEERRVTALYVTHDLEEAVAVGQRLALMRSGKIVQTGTLDQLRSEPADLWVEAFLR